jgi:hypothetical protein
LTTWICREGEGAYLLVDNVILGSTYQIKSCNKMPTWDTVTEASSPLPLPSVLWPGQQNVCFPGHCHRRSDVQCFCFPQSLEEWIIQFGLLIMFKISPWLASNKWDTIWDGCEGRKVPYQLLVCASCGRGEQWLMHWLAPFCDGCESACEGVACNWSRLPFGQLGSKHRKLGWMGA